MVADFRLKILVTRKKFETRRKKYNVQKLQTPSVRDEFKLELKNRFSVLSIQNEAVDIEATWRAIKMYVLKQVRKYWDLEKIKRNGSQRRRGKK
jgi:hypothetical protein